MFGVNRGGERLRAARRRFQDKQVLRRTNIEEEFTQGAGQWREWRRLLSSSERAVAFGGLDKLQLAKIAREGGLGDAHTEMSEPAAEFILIYDWLSGDELQDLPLAETFVVAHDGRR
jgi:hypothetical protein